jgi:hypothetical protein
VVVDEEAGTVVVGAVVVVVAGCSWDCDAVRASVVDVVAAGCSSGDAAVSAVSSPAMVVTVGSSAALTISTGSGPGSPARVAVVCTDTPVVGTGGAATTDTDARDVAVARIGTAGTLVT